MTVTKARWTTWASGTFELGKATRAAFDGPWGSVVHCMIIVEEKHCSQEVIEAALAQIAQDRLSVTITVVVDQARLTSLALTCGMAAVATTVDMSPEELRRQAFARAVAAARDVIDVIPSGIASEHRVAANWRKALRMAHQDDVLVVAAPPSRRWDRLRLSRRDAQVRRAFTRSLTLIDSSRT